MKQLTDSEVLATLERRLKESRPTLQQWDDYKATKNDNGGSWGASRIAAAKVHNHLAKLWRVGQSQMYQRSYWLKRSYWCISALTSLEDAYMKGAEEALAVKEYE